MVNHYYLVGIGGAGMSAIARVLLDRGCRVSGSDQRDSETLHRLRSLGASVWAGHRSSLPPGVTVVVRSDAIPDDNPEVTAARQSGLPVLFRADALDQILRDHRTIAVTGTHGKTTTTGMISTVLEACGLAPLTLLGGEMGPEKSTARIGRGQWAVAEACEAFNAFLRLHPEVSVITNIEPDHLDFHGDLEGLLTSFRTFVSGLRPDGLLVACVDSPPVSDLLAHSRAPVVTYGLGEGHFTARDLKPTAQGVHYTLLEGGEARIRVELPVPGSHNAANSLAVFAVGRHVGLDPRQVAEALRSFRGVRRRFETLGEGQGIRVVDDYAHHPTEIRATLAAARSSVRPERLVAVFQPHLYSRTRYFLREFAEALSEADLLVLTDIYGAREKPIPGVTGETLLQEAKSLRNGRPTLYVPRRDRVPAELRPQLRAGDLVLFMGAGDIREAGEALAADLAAEAGTHPSGEGR